MMRLSEIKKLFFHILLLLTVAISSCSKMTTIGKRKHQFGEKATKIIWFQVAGLSDEHIGLIKFDLPLEDAITPLEESLCMGKVWGFNLYNLRVPPEEGFLSQMTASKNIKNKCVEADKKFIWDYLEPYRFQAMILEGETENDQSIVGINSCGNNERLANTTTWLMQKKNSSNGNKFHYQKDEPLMRGISYDRSCQTKGCYASLTDNAKDAWRRLNKEPGQKLFIIRDFTYFNALKKKNIIRAKEKLNELTQLYQYFRDLTKKESNTLLLMSTSTTQNFEYPSEGKQWNDFLKKGKNVFYRKTSLLSNVWADGPGSENFCSYMGEADVLKRILWAPEKGVMGIFEL